jgi:hypothetical protein
LPLETSQLVCGKSENGIGILLARTTPWMEAAIAPTTAY